MSTCVRHLRSNTRDITRLRVVRTCKNIRHGPKDPKRRSVDNGNRHAIKERRWGHRFYEQVWLGTGTSPCGELWKSKKLRFVQCDVEAGDAATVMAQLKLTAAKQRQASLALFCGGFLAHNASVQSSVF